MSGSPDAAAPDEQQQTQTQRKANKDDSDEEVTLKYGAVHVARLFVPVSLCMLLVVLIMHSIPQFKQQSPVSLLMAEREDMSVSEKLSTSTINALIVVAAVVVLTILIIVLFYFKLYKVLYGIFIVSSCMILGVFTSLFLWNACFAWDVHSDYMTMCFLLWNFLVVGMFVIHWKGPLRLQQLYLIITSAFMSLVLMQYLPDWSTWFILGALALYDMVAVLCPFGPLKLLVKMSSERQEPIMSSLIYSSGAGMVLYLVNVVMAGVADASQSESTSSTSPRQAAEGSPQKSLSRESAGTQPEAHHQKQSLRETNTATKDNDHDSTQPATDARSQQKADKQASDESEEEQDNVVRLGLGDFIFYSVLVGKASFGGDWVTTIACFVAILVGLCFTLLLLAVYKRALPALPISIAFGLLFYFCTSYVIEPFTRLAAFRHVFL